MNPSQYQNSDDSEKELFNHFIEQLLPVHVSFIVELRKSSDNSNGVIKLISATFFMFVSEIIHQPFSLLLRTPSRFLKTLITMYKLPINSSNKNPFSTPQSLSHWLKPRLPSDSFASWGIKPGTKNVHNLWLELSQGETTLADSSPPVRTVNVVTLRIFNDAHDKILIESHQELSDGTVRSRNRPLSEKMKPGESYDSAAIRAVKEELGSEFGEVVKIVPDSYEVKMEERASVSYPGLPACYVLHNVDATVDGLPAGEFCSEEEEEYEDSDETRVADEAVSVRKHYWKWVDHGSV